MEDFLLPCLFKKLFGIDCIGCGIQRAFVLLFEGNFKAAFYMFPAIYTTFLFGISLVFHLFEKRHSYFKSVILFAILNALIMIISYVYKMRFLF